MVKMTALSFEAAISPSEAESELSRLRSRYPKLVIQIAGMDRPPSAWAVRMIAAQTVRAGETGSLLADKPEVDLLLRLSGTGQITEALRRTGYKRPGRKLLVAIGTAPELSRLRRELEKSGSKFSVASEDGRISDEQNKRLVEDAALLGVRT